MTFGPRPEADRKQVVSSLVGAANGIGALRPHASSAHGHGRVPYKVESRHKRLAIHAVHTVVAFVLGPWKKRTHAVTPPNPALHLPGLRPGGERLYRWAD
ncbi:MAG TPA: abortive infection family protein [Polyangia bacterium]|jgi:hypothetical protein|nr:abortive infection family protein [Polyangia bacterium]